VDQLNCLVVPITRGINSHWSEDDCRAYNVVDFYKGKSKNIKIKKTHTNGRYCTISYIIMVVISITIIIITGSNRRSNYVVLWVLFDCFLVGLLVSVSILL